ncbi:MAG: DUF4416 family protein [Planctomycetes bacterium]|nr:DUF4416 family protein [Planctomycetota bacterium]
MAQPVPRWYPAAVGEIRVPAPAKLIVGILAGGASAIPRAELEARFGPVDLESGEIPFRFTDYYEAEMGRDLVRKFLSFARPIDPSDLPAIKRWTNELEGPPPRRVNLDPGYVTTSKLVLATTKDHAHRVYLADGIHAEVTLIWTKGSFVPREWTYPDYRTPEYVSFFNAVRESLRASGRPNS